MRLLQLGVDDRLTITKDLLPHELSQYEYAILSHTWGPDEGEVTFKDISEGTGLNKKGYQKILFCGRRAATDKLNYFWVDTCCINKPNLTEYAEAINSMFRWYRGASRCYVYLEDVLRDDRLQIHEPPRSTWKVAFRNSRWFTRGWTLQELIAPSSVEFFSLDGQRLGDKTSLEQEIHSITNIPIHVLRGASLSALSVEERIAWSDNRRTTRPEDKAYSLLGILGIHMSPIYGEGEGEAFERLRRISSARTSSTTVLLTKLPVASGASFDSHAEEHNPVCLPNTRIDLLREITEWTENHDAKSVYWLNGMAGTGKSTISRTLADTFAKKGTLGATFFFKRGESDRGSITKFFSTIASQLVVQVPEATIHVQNAIDADPNIIGKAMWEQFKKLILDPLSKISGNDYQDHSYVIIVDALDECEREEDVQLLIKLFSHSKMLRSPRLRVFLTSRPELPIRLGFKAVDGEYQDLVLHEIAEPVIEHDIAAFFKHELTEIKLRYDDSVPEKRRLPLSWPGQANIDILVTMAVPLFIFAATTCRFIADRKMGNPDRQLKEVLQYRTRSQESQLDATYLPVLHYIVAGLSRRKKAEVLDRFRQIIGLVITLENPLPISALTKMLNLSKSDILDLFDLLHSVLSVPSSHKEPVRLLHLSFRDFLLDPEKSDSPFWINEKETHQQLGAHCLRIMNEALRADICNVGTPGTPVSSMSHDKINDNLPPEVQYACRFWSHHLEQGGSQISDEHQVLNFLTTQFLHWLEALSWIGRTSEALQAVKTLQSLILPDSSAQISNFLDDAIRFILAFKFIIKTAPLQLYSSALLFAPERSIIRSIFERDIPDWISLRPKVPNIWGPSLQTLEGHSDWVESVTFSPDGKFVASGAHDETIRIWAADTGDLLQTLESNNGEIISVAFSPDGKVLASGSRYAQLWAVDTGKLLRTLESHNTTVISVTFSSDGKSVASVLQDKIVQLWTITGHLLQTLEGHVKLIESITFSPNSKLIASVSKDSTIRIWATDTGNLLRTLEDSLSSVNSIAFSPDGKVLASGQTRGIQLWDVETGNLLQIFKSNSSFNVGIVKSLAFSSDGKLIASASSDNTVRLWATNTGDLLQTYRGHNRSVGSVAFSPNNKLIASGSYDKTVRLWAINTDDLLQTLEDHSGSIMSVIVSPNGKLIASVSSDKTVRLWATNTGDLLQTFEGHYHNAYSVAFSPNNKLIVSSSSGDVIVRLWDVNTGNTASSMLSCNRLVGSGLSTNNSWITTDGENLLWLPVECRPIVGAIFGSVVAIGSRSGRFLLLHLDKSRSFNYMDETGPPAVKPR
ncbi:vegetative incompatibility protein HET-E-1 [Xylaria telfairii]|nr:vegetative incompatibility protein HET-E-1 [Xylaria telfairii]